MRATIKAHAVISPQETFGGGFPGQIREVVSDRLKSVEPEYKDHINPVMLRRMPRIIRMGLASAKLCTDRAGGVVPDGIVIGTGLGCLDNLEKFLVEMLEKDERITTVLPFINSTHNAVAGQVSMIRKNQNYSSTYCHRSFSFESALLDALLLINEGKAGNVLVGAIDEITDDFVRLHGYLDAWKKPVSNLELFSAKTAGTIAGEGSAFFMLSDEVSSGYPVVTGVHTFLASGEVSGSAIADETRWFLSANGLDAKDIDVYMAGINGDTRVDSIYYNIYNNIFIDKHFAAWKHLCGEYYTSTGFAMWLISEILRNQSIPESVLIRGGNGKKLKNALIYNHWNAREHSLVLLSKP